MKGADKHIAELLRRDADDVPLPSLKHIDANVRRGRHRLDDLAAMLVEQPRDPLVTEAWLFAFIDSMQRRIRGFWCLGPTFALAVRSMKRALRDALLTSTRRGLVALAKLAIDDPVRVSDPRLLAHSLTIDGELIAWLGDDHTKHLETLGVGPDASSDELRAAFRRAVMRTHPDRNQSADAVERFHDVQRAYEALR